VEEHDTSGWSEGLKCVQVMTNRTYYAGFKGTPLMDQRSGLIQKLASEQILCPKDVADVSGVAGPFGALGE
jgi:hypothetical protein